MALAFNNPYEKYKQSSVNSASKEELTLMLYDGGIKFCNLAIADIERKDPKSAHKNIVRAEDIVEELQITLDKKYEISASFDALYSYMHRRLIDANISKDISAILEVRDLFREFRDMWKEAMKLAKSQQR